MDEQEETRASIQVIDLMMSLLNSLAEQPAPVNLMLLAQMAQLHPSTAHRILSVMVRNRMVEGLEPGTYCLGVRLLEFGVPARTHRQRRRDAGNPAADHS